MIVERLPVLRRWLTPLATLASLGVVGWLLVRDADQLRSAPWQFEPVLFVLALVFQLSTVAIASQLWGELSAELGAGADARRHSRAYALAILAKRIPGGMWHVLGRAAIYRKDGVGARVAIGGSLLEFGLLLATGLVFVLGTWPGLGWWGPLGAVATAVLLPVGYSLARSAAPAPRRAALPSPRRLSRWLTLNLLSWILGCTGVFLEFRALYPIAWDSWSVVVNGTALSILVGSLFVVIPSGLGVREVTLVGLLDAVVPVGVASALAVAFRVTISVLEVLWAAGVLATTREPAESRA